jgi:hypothetical protein
LCLESGRGIAQRQCQQHQGRERLAGHRKSSSKTQAAQTMTVRAPERY